MSPDNGEMWLPSRDSIPNGEGRLYFCRRKLAKAGGAAKPFKT